MKDPKESCFGDPSRFAILTRQDSPGDATGFFCLSAGGRKVGDFERRTTYVIQVGFFERALPVHAAPWPGGFEQIADPVASFEFLKKLAFGDADPRVGYDSPFHRMVLTNNLGEPFDGFFAILRPAPGGEIWLVDDQDGRPSVARFGAAAYFEAARKFIEAQAPGSAPGEPRRGSRRT